MMNKEQAMNVLRNTFIDLELLDGTKVKLTLSFYLLKKLEEKHPELAEAYYALQRKKQSEMRDHHLIIMLYTAYVCANLNAPERLDEDAFAMLLPSDREAIGAITKKLMGGKKA